MSSQKTEAVTNRIFTIPNVISFIRLCMVPVYMVLLLNGYDLLATFMFALAAGTDWIDGQLARRTNCVSKLGQLLDPAVDRVLMICGVIGLMLVGRLPIWIVFVVLGRDLMLLVGGAYLLKRYHERVAVIYPGKVATTFLFVGFAGLLLNMPLIGGLGWFEASWLPGFGSEACSWGIWFVYAGLLIGLFTTLYYVLAGYRKMQKARRLEAKGRVR
ncbi:MAG: CDP-alcohol phosphatidyltransferase family protein [Senegalimassilia sp.]|uniref:CDP-alcohol phosphatidyltransferase family protein n=1 Tax=Senegalimassilia TaxID=1473205 RepID=UPI0023F1DE3E|nr:MULTISPECIES: CDP-alcohol phosphatidyltransferase family protein [Senegalimassilia]MDR4054288.1 CDP-alcohol phosphatidyltransferase family protein [Senegalimassilia sp.]MEE0145400.1 CDP-alcohol phosphatidyltransferase family protein [Senegalimassilia anaerobia]MEE0227063.1 CDP-alcohol phosphatidyltransferase family protein [Senegalimassilia anaerobia]MEE0302852.1 CDP-alcohol phosphatidyltransferase family protein [Senegalimassilia anaerobia]